MGLTPVRSIFSGFVVFVVVFIILLIFGIEKAIFLLFLSFFLGGFVTMFFIQEKKLKYLFCETILILIFSIIIFPYVIPRISIGFIFLFLFVFIFTGVGGFIGKSLAEKIIEKKIWSFHPIISVTLGFVVFFIFNTFILYLTPLGFSTYVEIWLLEDVCSLVIGGFIATYYAKEKKIQYGIYVGIISVVLLGLVPQLISGLLTDLSSLVITVLTYTNSIIAATTGSYLAILIAKHQKLGT